MKKIIAFSLWGNNLKYTIGAIKNAQIALDSWIDWETVFYVGPDVPGEIIEALINLKSTVHNMSDSGWNGMFWRFFAADSDNIVISRDTDSRLGLREKAAVDEWLASDKDFHIMRDHPYHQTEILGGMWGTRNGLLKGITNAICEYDKGEFDDKYQVDQNFLREIVYPKIKDKAIVHDEFFEKKPFPMNAPPRTSIYFVGQVYDYAERPEFT